MGFASLWRTSRAEHVQGANSFGYADWTGLIGYSAIDDALPQVSESQALGLPPIGRGVDLMCGVIGGLTPYRVKNAASVAKPTEVLDPPALLDNPDPAWHGRSAWTSAVVRDLMLYGNAFADKRNTDYLGFPQTLPLIAAERVSWNPDEGCYFVARRQAEPLRLEPAEVFHAVVNPQPGRRMGVGILGQYQVALATMLAVENAQLVVMQAGRPVGVLSFDVDLVPEELKAAKAAFLAGVKRDGIAAVTRAKFDPVSWSATDLALVDAREYSMRLASQITGISGYLLGVPAESRVYSNMETEWSNFLRVSVDKYIAAIQDAYSGCFPRGTVVRYNTDELRRPEASTRWQIYQTAVSMGAMTVAEVRQAEHMGPVLEGESS